MPMPAESPNPELCETVGRFFGPDSPLRQAASHGGRPYEERPQQKDMAETIAECLAAGEHLCIEAPTGVGKSFAYLVPAIHFARAAGKPVVISTHTIALQEQLLGKDLPVLTQLVEVPFSAALGKGRGNYLCLRRIRNVIGDQQLYLPMDELLPEVRRIAAWAQTTTDGSRSDLDFVPSAAGWMSVCSEPGICPKEESKEDEGCFFRAARRKLYRANIVVVNHALLCADLAVRRESGGEQSLLPDWSALIIDEAHTFPEVAATHLGVRLSTYGVMSLFERLYNPKTGRGLLGRDAAAGARRALLAAHDATKRFFARLRGWLEEQDENPLVFTTAGHIPNLCAESWSALGKELHALVNGEGLAEEHRDEVKVLHERLEDCRRQLDVFLEMGIKDSVYWFERGGRQLRHITFNVVPIEVHDQLRELLFERNFPVVMTSATLAVAGKLDYFLGQVGAADVRPRILDSPFDFSNNVDLYLPHGEAPLPKQTEAFNEFAVAKVRSFIELSKGKAFVLFTSYAMMNRMADEMAEFFETNAIKLMVQGRELPRTRMLELFREDLTSVIFGTDSFWMGVDVPGEALSNVIIVKLPFPVPTHPLVAARSERLEADGKSSFREYTLPEAILKFRQGIGRLVRSRDDRGIIVVLDARIVRASYGRSFMGSIPDCRNHIF